MQLNDFEIRLWDFLWLPVGEGMGKDKIKKEEKGQACKVGPMKTGLPWKDCATLNQRLFSSSHFRKRREISVTWSYHKLVCSLSTAMTSPKYQLASTFTLSSPTRRILSVRRPWTSTSWIATWKIMLWWWGMTSSIWQPSKGIVNQLCIRSVRDQVAEVGITIEDNEEWQPDL